jgi:small-conductance mechanosensitive channel
MLVNELQSQAMENQRQAELIEQQATKNRQLSAQLAKLKGRFEQAMTEQRETRSLTAEASFNR